MESGMIFAFAQQNKSHKIERRQIFCETLTLSAIESQLRYPGFFSSNEKQHF